MTFDWDAEGYRCEILSDTGSTPEELAASHAVNLRMIQRHDAKQRAKRLARQHAEAAGAMCDVCFGPVESVGAAMCRDCETAQG